MQFTSSKFALLQLFLGQDRLTYHFVISTKEATMTPIAPVIHRMTFEEAYWRGMHSRGLKFEDQGNTYYLHAGLSDKVYVFARSICIYVLTINSSLEYIGLDAYMPKEPNPINTLFLHSENQIIECLGRRWEQLLPKTIAERLVEFLI